MCAPPRVTNKTTENMSKADSGAKMVLGGLEPADTGIVMIKRAEKASTAQKVLLLVTYELKSISS